MIFRDGSFEWEGHRLAYSDHGSGERALVLMHGLLMNRWMYDRLAPEMAARGFRVVTIDVLGHGESDRPADMREYSMASFGHQIAALIDHLELDRPVVGGTSLGANATLEFAVAHPNKARALLIEMPVLDNALLGVGLGITPTLLGLRFGRPLLSVLAALTRRIPRTSHLIDIGLDWVRQDPRASQAVIEGLAFARFAPPHSERVRIEVPTLVIGHRGEPLHPFSDSGMLVDELPNAELVNASSILEWRLRPARLDDLLERFLTDTYAESPEAAVARSAVG
ncbi:MAG: alpha/beta hydrolase [Actinomycetota bacterium]|nr:alpha/beta hydrolase [Actinomycetota bacterium]